MRRTACATSPGETSMIGSRLVFWLHASWIAFSVSGYCSGVVACFSIRQPRMRASSALRMGNGDAAGSVLIASSLARVWLILAQPQGHQADDERRADAHH